MPQPSASTSGASQRDAGASDAPQAPGGVERAATVAAAALGLVGYLYALGGIVVWLRVQAAQLAPDGAIVAIDPRHLLAVGARVVAFELFLLLAISAIVTGVVAFAIVRRGGGPLTRPPHERFEAFEAAWKDKGTLGGFVGPELGLLLVTVGLSVDGKAGLRTALWVGGAVLGGLALMAMVFRLPPAAAADPSAWSPKGWRKPLKKLGDRIGAEGLRVLSAGLLFAAAVTGIFLLPILQGTILLAGTAMIYAGPLLRWPGTSDFGTFRRELLLSSGVWTAIAVSTAIALAWVATPPVDFTRADVASLDGTKTDSGAYLARGDGGVYLGICTRTAHGEEEKSTDAHIRLVPAEQSAKLELGHGSYEFDAGGRPSIWEAVKAVVGGGSAATDDAPLHHPLRGEAESPCGPA